MFLTELVSHRDKSPLNENSTHSILQFLPWKSQSLSQQQSFPSSAHALNIRLMSVTELVFQVDMFPLNARALQNIFRMFVT